MLDDLARCRYISLTTFRRDGTEASTPVWVVSDDGRRLLVWTGAETWKAKRIRREPRVLVAESDFRGRELGPRREAQARLLGEDAGPLIVRLLRRKYGWQRYALELQGALSRLARRTRGAGAAYIEIT
jgi:PPOX class probable F420-dependent enzyme